MNIERMLALADELENPRDVKAEFNFGTFISPPVFMITGCPFYVTVREGIKGDCDTVCCVGGLACLMFGKPEDHVGSGLAAELLGLSVSQSRMLFFDLAGFHERDEHYKITRQLAAKGVRRMIAEEQAATQSLHEGLNLDPREPFIENGEDMDERK